MALYRPSPSDSSPPSDDSVLWFSIQVRVRYADLEMKAFARYHPPESLLESFAVAIFELDKPRQNQRAGLLQGTWQEEEQHHGDTW